MVWPAHERHCTTSIDPLGARVQRHAAPSTDAEVAAIVNKIANNCGGGGGGGGDGDEAMAVTAFLCNVGHPSFLDCNSAQPAGKFDVTLWGDGGDDVGLIPENLQWQLKPVAGEAETFFIVSKAHNKFLDSHGNGVWLWGDGVDIGQDPDGIKWRRQAVDNGQANTFYLIHVKTNKFLDSPGGARVALWGDGIDTGRIPQNLQWHLRAV